MTNWELVPNLDVIMLASRATDADLHLRERISREWGPSDVDSMVADAKRRQADAIRGWLKRQSASLYVRLLVSVLALFAMLTIAPPELPNLLPAAAIAIFAAATLSSIGGFAFSAICGALLFHLLLPVAAVQLMIICSIAIQSMSVLALRRTIEWRVLLRFLLGGIISLPLGVYFLLIVDAHIYAHLMGGLLVAYGVFMLLRPRTRLGFQRAWADVFAGACGGITGGFAGFPGAFVTVWCGLKGWDKDRQRGVYQPYILIMQVLSLAVISAVVAGSHGTASPIGVGSLIYVPAALLGTWCGLSWYRKLSDRQFAVVVNALLVVAGVQLVV